MKIAILFFMAVVPMTALANQYRCGAETIEASSISEAEYKHKQTSKGKAFSCREEAYFTDIFRRELSANGHLRPYLPSDIKEDRKKSYTCYPNGGFVADTGNGGREMGSCREFQRISDGSAYRLFFFGGIGVGGQGSSMTSGSGQGMVSMVWKRGGGDWVPWVEFQSYTNAAVKTASAGAQQYAASHGGVAPVATSTTEKSSPSQSNNAPADPAQAGQTAVKDATKALKGLFGR